MASDQPVNKVNTTNRANNYEKINERQYDCIINAFKYFLLSVNPLRRLISKDMITGMTDSIPNNTTILASSSHTVFVRFMDIIFELCFSICLFLINKTEKSKVISEIKPKGMLIPKKSMTPNL